MFFFLLSLFLLFLGLLFGLKVTMQVQSRRWYVYIDHARLGKKLQSKSQNGQC